MDFTSLHGESAVTPDLVWLAEGHFNRADILSLTADQAAETLLFW